MVRLALEEVDPLLMALIGSASRPAKQQHVSKQTTYFYQRPELFSSNGQADSSVTACARYNTQRLETQVLAICCPAGDLVQSNAGCKC